jgi:hypothetical protein
LQLAPYVPFAAVSVLAANPCLETSMTSTVARAKRLHGGNLSAAVADGVSRLREEEATHRLLSRLGAPPLSDARYAEIVEEWNGAAAGPKRVRRKSAV